MNACSTTITIPKIISVKEAMEIFGIGRPTLDEAIQRMELTAYKPNGKKYLLDAIEVFDWIKTKKYDSGFIAHS
jgi:excisionase family DNA binding protein